MTKSSPSPFNILIVAQAGRLTYEAVLFAASLRHFAPEFPGTLYVAEPQPGPLWPKDPRISDGAAREMLVELGARILPFENTHFGARYAHGNKIEALAALPEKAPFVFFDTDTLITGDPMRVPFDFDRPSASLRREGTWPQIELYGPGYTQIWKSLYDMMGLDFESSLDLTQPDEHWERYLYFSAGFFYYRCPREFGARFLETALAIEETPPKEIVLQSLRPWLDQVALPLVIHGLGGGRDTLEPGWLDGRTSCHYRFFPLLYARESDAVVDALRTVAAPNRIKKVLKAYDPMKRMIFQGRGEKVRALFDRADLPPREQAIRKRIKEAGLWIR